MMRPINLIPGPRRHAKACRTLLRMWIGAATVWAVVLPAVCVLSYELVGQEPVSLVQENDKAREGARASRRAILTCEREIAEARERLESSQAVGQQPDWSVLLALVAEGLGEEVVLEQCRLQEAPPVGPARPAPGSEAKAQSGELSMGGRFVFTLSGLSRTQAAVSQFVLRLEKCGLFDQVRIVRTSRQDFLNGKAVAFELECLLQGSPETVR